MLGSYVPVLIMLVVATVVAGGMVVGSFLLGPKKPSKYKTASYECGMTPVGNARERFPVKFFLVAMLFIIFDIETIFLYPWAVTFRDQARSMKIFMLAEMAVFVVILFIGYFYILGRKALDWDEGQSEAVARDKSVFKARPPIRFGNENSGPVRTLPAPSPAALAGMPIVSTDAIPSAEGA